MGSRSAATVPHRSEQEDLFSIFSHNLNPHRNSPRAQANRHRPALAGNIRHDTHTAKNTNTTRRDPRMVARSNGERKGRAGFDVATRNLKGALLRVRCL